MRNIYILFFILNCLPASLFSQELNLILEPGIGSYGMKDLKEINTSSLGSLIFDAKITDNFPVYWNNKLVLQYTTKKLLTFGVTCTYQSTGSRISRVDYSGDYHFDTRIRSFSPGLMAELYFPINKFRFSFRNEIGIEFTKLRLNEYLKIKSVSEKGYSFTSKNWYYEPTVNVSCPFKIFRLGIATGYLLDLKKGAFKSPESSDNYSIELSNGKAVTSDWSGLRIRLTLSFNFLQFKSVDIPADTTN